MYSNLKAEMARKGIKIDEIAELLKVSRKTVTNKIHGKTLFTVPEGLLVNVTFFPDCDFKYLFTTNEELQDTKTA